MPHYYIAPLVESSITVWHPRQRRLIRLRQPLGVDQSQAQTIVLGHSGLALVATVDPLHDARVTKFAEHRDEWVSSAARTALAQIAGDREIAAAARCGEAIAGLLKAPPAAWHMRPLRPARARTLLAPGYYVWLDPTERTPMYFEPTAPRKHSKGWRDSFDTTDGLLNGRVLPEGAGGAAWIAGSLVTIASNQARITAATSNVGDSADLWPSGVGGSAVTDSDDAYVEANLLSVISGGSNALLLYGFDVPDTFVGGLETGWWGHAGNVYGMWSYATSAAVATTGSTTFVPGLYRVWRSGSSVGFQRWSGLTWDDVLGPSTNTADQGDGGCSGGFAAFSYASSGVFAVDNFTCADDDYAFGGATEVTGGTVAAGAALYAGTISVRLAGSYLASGAQAYPGTAALRLAGAHVANTATLYPGQATLSVNGASIGAVSTLFPGAAHLAVVGAHRSSTAQVFPGSLVGALGGAFIPSAAQTFAGSVHLSGLVGGTIASTAALYPGDVDLTVDGDCIFSTAKLFAGHVPGGLADTFDDDWFVVGRR